MGSKIWVALGEGGGGGLIPLHGLEIEGGDIEKGIYHFL